MAHHKNKFMVVAEEGEQGGAEAKRMTLLRNAKVLEPWSQRQDHLHSLKHQNHHQQKGQLAGVVAVVVRAETGAGESQVPRWHLCKLLSHQRPLRKVADRGQGEGVDVEKVGTHELCLVGFKRQLYPNSEFILPS